MANTFKNAATGSSTDIVPLYTCPSSTTAVIHAVYVSNVDGTNDATISVSVSADNGSNYYHLAKTVTVPADSTVYIISKDTSIYLDETDLLRLQASAANMLEYVCSYETLNDA